MSWKQRILEVFGDVAKPLPPATGDELAALTTWLGEAAPSDLLEFLQESNGLQDNYGTWIISNAERLRSETDRLRGEESWTYLEEFTWEEVQSDPELREEYKDHITFDHYLFVSDCLGNGDHYAILLRPVNDSPKGQIVHWDHETATFEPFADNLDHYLVKLAADIHQDQKQKKKKTSRRKDKRPYVCQFPISNSTDKRDTFTPWFAQFLNSEYLILAGNCRVAKYDLESGKFIEAVWIPSEWKMLGLAPDCQSVLCITPESELICVDIKTQTIVRSFPIKGSIYGYDRVVYAGDAICVGVINDEDESELLYWPTLRRKRPKKIRLHKYYLDEGDYEYQIGRIAMSETKIGFFLSCDGEGLVTVIERDTGDLCGQMKVPRSTANALELSESEKLVLYHDGWEALHVWDYKQDCCVMKIDVKRRTCPCATFVGESTIGYTEMPTGVKLVDIDSGRVIRHYEGRAAVAGLLTTSPNNQILVGCNPSCRARVYDISDL